MANKYAKANKETNELFESVLQKHHGELGAVGVTFDVLFGYAPVNDEGERTGSALKKHGYPVNSLVRIVNLRDRVKGNADAEVILDGDTWEGIAGKQQEAIIDRALEQFEIARNIDGEVILDTHGRPKLKLKQADWNISIFTDVINRHGANSEEMIQLNEMSNQLVFNFTLALPEAEE